MYPIDGQKESVGGPGLSGLQSDFISQLCKLLTREAQHRLALDGKGLAQTCFVRALFRLPVPLSPASPCSQDFASGKALRL